MVLQQCFLPEQQFGSILQFKTTEKLFSFCFASGLQKAIVLLAANTLI
jgi:hypothetical protein